MEVQTVCLEVVEQASKQPEMRTAVQPSRDCERDGTPDCFEAPRGWAMQWDGPALEQIVARENGRDPSVVQA